MATTRQTLVLLTALAGATTVSQAPELAQQYRQAAQTFAGGRRGAVTSPPDMHILQKTRRLFMMPMS